MDEVNRFLERVSEEIVNPLIGFVFALAFLYFLWGAFLFIRDAESDTGRKEGRDSMIWGVVGMFIMVGVYGIIALITDTLDVDNPFPSQG